MLLFRADWRRKLPFERSIDWTASDFPVFQLHLELGVLCNRRKRSVSTNVCLCKKELNSLAPAVLFGQEAEVAVVDLLKFILRSVFSLSHCPVW